jgi:hypothetical protein
VSSLLTTISKRNSLTIDLATFRMVVLADELLEGFFDKALAASFQLERSEVEDYHQANQKSAGVLGGLMNLVVNDSWVASVEMDCDTDV